MTTLAGGVVTVKAVGLVALICVAEIIFHTLAAMLLNCTPLTAERLVPLIKTLRRNGLLLISGGVLLMLLFSFNHAAATLWQGYALFLFGSLLWAGFTLALRRSGLGALEGATVVTYGSIPLLILDLLLSREPLQLHHLPFDVMALQVLLGGIGVGLVLTISYAYAVARLGADRAAMAGSLTPVVATLLAVPLFGEVPPASSMLGMALIIGGVTLSNRTAGASINRKGFASESCLK